MRRVPLIFWCLSLPYAPAGVLGAWLGAQLGPQIGGGFLRKGFAVFLLLFGLAELLHRKRRPE